VGRVNQGIEGGEKILNILITGCTGFIGRSLSRVLYEQGHSVYALTRQDKFYKDLPNWFTPVQGDLTKPRSLKQAVKSVKPDIVIHLAALTPVRFSFSNPVDYAKINYLGTVNLIKAIKNIGIKQFIHASTTEVYRSKDGLIKEGDPLFGGTPYGVSKVAADFYVQMSGLAWNIPYTILRPANTFGRQFELPDEARGYLVEKAIIQMLTQNKVMFDGSPNSKRCWMHVDDHVGGYLKVIANERAIGKVFNVSPNNPMSVGSVVEKIKILTGFNGEVLWNQNPRPYDPPSLCPDGSALMELGWKPKWNLDEGLKKTVEYWEEKLEVHTD
jgi:nucleoside-diphosphate-sugar epimerase